MDKIDQRFSSSRGHSGRRKRRFWQGRRMLYTFIAFSVGLHILVIFLLFSKKERPPSKRPLEMETTDREEATEEESLGDEAIREVEGQQGSVEESQAKGRRYTIMMRPKVAVKPQIKRTPVGRVDTKLMRVLPEFREEMDRKLRSARGVGIPETLWVKEPSLREPDKRQDMDMEFLDVSTLDYGRYKGLAFQDPENKREVKGFVYLCSIVGVGFGSMDSRPIFGLTQAINRFTNMEAKIEKIMQLSSRRIFEMPVLYVVITRFFEPNKQETENLVKYVQNGGFLIVDNPEDPVLLRRYGLPRNPGVVKLFREAFGRRAVWRAIPQDHPIYHAFFDLEGSPSTCGVEETSPGHAWPGLFLDDRLAVVYMDGGYYGECWTSDFLNPQLRMALNMTVFALTQKGSIAQRYAASYKEK